MDIDRLTLAKHFTLLSLLLAFAVAPVSVSAQEGEQGPAPCEKADAELNRVYKKIRKEYKSDTVFLEKLKLAQRAWIKFRNAHMEARFTYDPPAVSSFLRDCYCWELADLTEARVKDLKLWLKGIEEGDGCSGSVKLVPPTQ
jgi:uncharacterized protein YecT (DUF1311 family)